MAKTVTVISRAKIYRPKSERIKSAGTKNISEKNK